MNKLSKEVLRQQKGISFIGVSTCFIVYDKHQHFHMTKRSNNARDEHGKWELGGGGLKWGQKADDNLLRELYEELAVKPVKVNFLGYRDIFRKMANYDTHWLALDYAVLVNHDDVKNNEPDIFDDLGWYSFTNLPKPLHSQTMPTLNKYQEQLIELFKQI